MKKINLIMCIMFSLFIGGFFVYNIILPDSDFSPLENRTLSEMPEFSLEDLFSGEFTADYETYITDQFAFRDNFVEIKSTTERLLGKTENNGVYIGTDNRLIDKFPDPDLKNIENNINSINNFITLVDSINVEVFTTIFPMQNDIYADYLPNNAPTFSEKDVIESAETQIENFVNVYDTLYEHRDEYIYYYTDHHHTSLGAYYSYVDIMNAMGKTPMELPEKTTVTEDFNGTIFSKSGVRYAPSDSIDIYTENLPIIIEDQDGTREALLYDMSQLETNDKYAMFLGGNHPIVTIEGKGDGNLLIIKDSYTNSIVPFMTENFANIHIIDLRFMRLPASDYILQNNIDTVLIAYSVSNFELDKNLAFLN